MAKTIIKKVNKEGKTGGGVAKKNSNINNTNNTKSKQEKKIEESKNNNIKLHNNNNNKSIAKKSTSQKSKSVAAIPRNVKNQQQKSEDEDDDEDDEDEDEGFTKFESSDSEEEEEDSNDDEDNDDDDDGEEEDSETEIQTKKSIPIITKVNKKEQEKRFEEGKARAREVAAKAASNKSSTLGQFEYESSSEEEEEENDDEDESMDEDDNEEDKKTKSSKPSTSETEKKNTTKQQDNNDEDERGVLYIGRIPHGFYEDEMRGYFGQFGVVTRVRVSRNKKTGRSRHYGYIEFENREIAKIVQETMDNYLLLGHLLQVKLIPKDKVFSSLFWGASIVGPNGRFINNKNSSSNSSSKTLEANWHNSDISIAAAESHDQPRSKTFWQNLQNRANDRLQKSQQKFAALGISYAIPIPSASPSSSVVNDGISNKTTPKKSSTSSSNKKKGGKKAIAA